MAQVQEPALVDYAEDAELINDVAREIRRVEYESPRWRANADMAAAAIQMVRAHDRRKGTDGDTGDE